MFVVAAATGLFLTGLPAGPQPPTGGFSTRSLRAVLLRSLALLARLGFAVWYLNRTRGVGWMFVFFVALALAFHNALVRTKRGKAVYAVGGNVEAAGLASINVRLTYTSVFTLCTVKPRF